MCVFLCGSVSLYVRICRCMIGCVSMYYVCLKLRIFLSTCVCVSAYSFMYTWICVPTSYCNCLCRYVFCLSICIYLCMCFWMSSACTYAACLVHHCNAVSSYSIYSSPRPAQDSRNTFTGCTYPLSFSICKYPNTTKVRFL